jgi:hypothetical protein
MAHSVLVIAYHVLDRGVAYPERATTTSSSGSWSASSSGSATRSPLEPMEAA